MRGSRGRSRMLCPDGFCTGSGMPGWSRNRSSDAEPGQSQQEMEHVVPAGSGVGLRTLHRIEGAGPGWTQTRTKDALSGSFLFD